MTTATPIPIQPARPIYGASAVLLPYFDDGRVDWGGFETLLGRTVEAGLVPAVNMDTGYANLIDEKTRAEVLRRTKAMETAFIGGAFVADHPGEPYASDAYRAAAGEVVEQGGQPILFQSFGLTALKDERLADAYEKIGREVGDFLAFELGTMFAPFGRIYSLDEYRRLLSIETCVGAKHSSLSRAAEWDRLAIRDEMRPDFRVLTGNDLAIDMVQYGSDYLLGLSAFSPEAFAKRDRYWASGDPRFYELNDWLQYLGFFAFRDPVPAYKHTAAQFLHLRGLIEGPATHPHSPTRPRTDVAILDLIRGRLDELIAA